MDVAASEFYSEKEKTYDLNFKDDVSPGFGICFYESAHVTVFLVIFSSTRIHCCEDGYC